MNQSGINGKKERLDENHFRHGYGNYPESSILKYEEFFLNNHKGHWQRHLKDASTFENFTDMDQNMC